MSDRNEGHHDTHSERIWYPSAPRSHHTPSILVFSSSSPPNNYTAQKTNRKTQQKTIHPRLTPQKAPFTPAYGSHAGNPVILLISLIFCVMILTKPHDNHVFQRLSRTCSSQQEIIFANFQACIQAFMPGYRLFFTLLLGESLGGMQKPNTKPNTEPFPNCCFFSWKRRPWIKFQGRLYLENLVVFSTQIAPISCVFSKNQRKTIQSRYSRIDTQITSEYNNHTGFELNTGF